MRFCEQNLCVPVCASADAQAGADGDSFSLENYQHATFLIMLGALTGDAVLTINSGAAAATKTTAETFNYRLGSAAKGSATADVLGDEATSAALTLTAADYQNRLLVVEMDGAELTSGQPWVTLNFSAAADALNVAVVAVLSQPRYARQNPPTAIS